MQDLTDGQDCSKANVSAVRPDVHMWGANALAHGC